MKKKIRILHVTKGFYPDLIGGIETFIDTLCAGLKDQCEFGIFCLGNKNHKYHYKNIEIYKFKRSFELSYCPFSLEALIKFSGIVNKYDIIHYHYPYPFMDILNLFSKNKKKIVTYHSDIVKQKILNLFYHPLKLKFLSSMNKIIVSSRQYLNTSKDLKSFKNKTHIINFGINKTKVKENYKLKKQKYILFVGSLRYYKGINILIEAAKKIKSKIFICGNGKDLTKLINLKNKLELKNVFFLGYVSEKYKNELLKHCELFVLPSNARSEAFGIAILEAMSFGKPIISCNIGSATSFINKNNVTGYVIQPNDPNLLSKKINFLLDKKNSKIKNYFSKNSYQRFSNFFTSKKMSANYLRLYRDIFFEKKCGVSKKSYNLAL